MGDKEKRQSIQKQLPRRPACRTGRGNIIVENKTNKVSTPELPVLISVVAFSSGASYQQLIQRTVALVVAGKA